VSVIYRTYLFAATFAAELQCPFAAPLSYIIDLFAATDSCRSDPFATEDSCKIDLFATTVLIPAELIHRQLLMAA
jgi:hypothetical protein